MSNTILTYWKYILGCLSLYSAGYEDAKSISKDAYIMTANIESTFARDTYIDNIYAVNTWIKCADMRGVYTKYIYTRESLVENIILRILEKLRIIFADSMINDYCLQLFIDLVFALINSVKYWNMWKSNLNLRNINIFNIIYSFL